MLILLLIYYNRYMYQEECYNDKCYKNKSNMVFVEYQNNVKTESGKNYAIIYKCRYCNTEFAKLMTDKNDLNPEWLLCVDSDKMVNTIPNRFL